MKRLRRTAALILCAVILSASVSCGKETVPEIVYPQEQTEGIVLFRNNISDPSFGSDAAAGAGEYAAKNGIRFFSTVPEEGADLYESIESVLCDGYSTAVFIGSEYSQAAAKLSSVTPDVQFILINAYPIGESGDNVVSVFLNDFECGYAAGYCAVASGHGNIGFFSGLETEWSTECCDGFVSGVCEAASLKLTDGEISVSISFGDALNGSEVNKTKAAELFENGCEHVFAYGSGADEAVRDAAIDADATYSSSFAGAAKQFEFAPVMDFGECVKYILEKTDAGEEMHGEKTVGLNEGCLRIELSDVSGMCFTDEDAKAFLDTFLDGKEAVRVEKKDGCYLTPFGVDVKKYE